MMSQPSGYFPVSEFPDDILGEILLHLPASDLVGSCVYVCKRWRDVINSQTLWKRKCKRDYYYTNEMFHDTEDFKHLYFKNPYKSNLVKNTCGQEGFSHWKITKNGGNQFTQESEPIGSHPVKNFAKCDDIDGPVGCWVTSFGECRKEQMIDLVERGCSPEILDKVRPDICVSEWYAARFDCGCEYKIDIKLLDADKKVLDRYLFTVNKGPGRDWFQLTHVFTSYPPGCRFIKYSHGGKDDRFWAGHYGVKITLSSLKFDFSHVAGPYEGTFQHKPQYLFESSSDSEHDSDLDQFDDVSDDDDYDDDDDQRDDDGGDADRDGDDDGEDCEDDNNGLHFHSVELKL